MLTAPFRTSMRSLTWPAPTLVWLRVILALLVMQFHYGVENHWIKPLLKSHPDWAPHLEFAGSGNLAVVGFFVLSGYLVGVVAVQRHDTRKVADLIVFTLSRYLRIFPLYVVLFAVICVLVVALGHSPGEPSTMLSRLLLLPTALGQIIPSQQPLYTQMTPVFWSATWTLVFDVLLYPMGFILLAFPRHLRALLVLLIGAQIVVAWAYARDPAPGLNHNAWITHAYTTLSFCLTAFLVGLTAQQCLHPWKQPWLWAGLAFVVEAMLMFFPWNVRVGFNACLSMIVFSVLIHALFQHGSSRQEANLGHYTYAVYLLHQWIVSPLFILIAAYWVGVRFEGKIIGSFRQWADRLVRQSVYRIEPLREMMLPGWSVGILWLAVGINMLVILERVFWT